ncbi:cupin domain-containing protein [Endozoicomonas numazuensis]|uniref:Cupin type-2 domain-containing protein n=1 Tax=Endozoicomonas numazuensis TaxID=1137799 RepID=A0A081NGL9_9GAMM|nr:cupin domain-containing protein [Endozoicomonas numazuensis]KEQ17592.1 hypothetical protein GZ78_17845 [Endozoicomonas numazuensis]
MIANIEEIEWDEWQHGEQYGNRSKNLGKAAGSRSLGMRMIELSPGKQSSPLLFHTEDEEHIFLVEGEVTLLEGDEQSHLIAGDYVCFLPGEGIGHALLNHSETVCRFLVMSQNSQSDIVVYPEHNRMLVKALGQVFSNQPEEGFN